VKGPIVTTIRIENRQKLVKINLQEVRRSLHKILTLQGCKDKEISLVFVDDEDIRIINREYLGKDRPTNVISFPMLEGEFGGINPSLLGDIVISTETALKHASEEGISCEDELDFLMIHAVLHLLGYNHENASYEETEKMERKERELFSHLKGYKIE
jgi:probable rRNA maturation factor